MIITQKLVFECEFCGKRMLNKGSMTLHERMCRKNPNNKHKCFQYCRWLNMTYEEGLRVFYCGNVNCFLSEENLYSYKLERNYIGRMQIERQKLIRMPLQCDCYEIEESHDEEYINNL